MHDSVLEGFLESAERDAERVGPQSDCVRLNADPATGHPPRRYLGLLKGAEHYVRDAGGSFVVTRRPIPFQIDFPDDYLQSLDANLQFRVLSTSRQLVHPNVLGGVVCLGGRFRPGTRLRSIVEQFHGIATSRVLALDHPFDPEAAEFFRARLDTVRAFASEPLWQRPLAGSVRVEAVSTPQALHPTEAS